jgi:hypothetical protein
MLRPRFLNSLHLQFSETQLLYAILSQSWFFEKFFTEILEFLKKLIQLLFCLLIGHGKDEKKSGVR